ncbi:MAG: 1-hydroxycarotenoid 3,4-desaturase CrtD [Ideonella sp.]
MERVIVIGAGIGGLVSALELAASGIDVLLLESAARPGGKLRELSIGGMPMDAGPTVFTMRWVFDELFDAVGSSLANHLTLQPLDVLARHAWHAGQHLDLYADRGRSADAMGAFAGPAAMRGYLGFCERAQAIYRTLEPAFLRGSKPTPLSLAARVGWRQLPDLMRISPFETLWSELGRYFEDPRLRQLFGRYATYCGASPWLAPATLMLVAHVEQAGVWMVEGGMHRIAQALASLAASKGAQLRYNAPVAAILSRDGRASGVRLADGEEISATAVVFNGDAAALAAGCLGPSVQAASAPVATTQRSLSALTWNLLAPTHGFPLARHTVFFSDDYAAEFDDLIRRQRLPSAPTVYVCAQDRGGASDPSQGQAERLLLIVNAPPTGDTRPPTSQELSQCEAQTFKLMARCGLRIERRADNTLLTTPQDFNQLFPATGGALYGRASHGWAASFSRPGSRSRMPGLYLAGGSVHPGPGVPMAALSGRQATASVLADRKSTAHSSRLSTSRSRPPATPGGTSTR